MPIIEYMSTAKVEFQFLSDNQKAIPILAKWYFDEWGYLQSENSLAKVTKKLHSFLNIDKIPLIVLASKQGEILGAAQLKYREMDIYPENKYWLGGVYVAENYRGNKIAEKIILNVISKAKTFGVKKLYLQTEDLSGGLYCHLGWQPLEQVNYRGLDVLVMENQINV